MPTHPENKVPSALPHYRRGGGIIALYNKLFFFVVGFVDLIVGILDQREMEGLGKIIDKCFSDVSKTK